MNTDMTWIVAFMAFQIVMILIIQHSHYCYVLCAYNYNRFLMRFFCGFYFQQKMGDDCTYFCVITACWDALNNQNHNCSLSFPGKSSFLFLSLYFAKIFSSFLSEKKKSVPQFFRRKKRCVVLWEKAAAIFVAVFTANLSLSLSLTHTHTHNLTQSLSLSLSIW